MSASLDGTLKMWEMNDGKVMKSWDAHGGGAMAVAICNDGTMVSTGRDLKVKVWDANGNAAGEMPPLAEPGHEVAIAVDGKQVIAGDWAGNVRMWTRAIPADEKLLPANPPTLELVIAGAQQQLVALNAAQQAAQAELTEKQSQLGVAQKQLVDLQTQIATYTAMLQSMNEAAVALKGQSDALVALIGTTENEQTAKRNAFAEKTNATNAAVAKKKELDDAIAALQVKRAAEGADIPSLDAQIADLSKQSQDQATLITTIQAELQGLQTEIDTHDKKLVESKGMLAAKTQEIAANTAKIQETTTAKANAEQQIEPTNNAIKAATDVFNAAQAKFNGAAASVAATQQRLEQAQKGLVRFQAALTEWATKRIATEQSIMSVQSQIALVQTTVAELKAKPDAVPDGVAKLEQAIAAMQAQIQQKESDLAIALIQQELLQQAYGKQQ